MNKSLDTIVNLEKQFNFAIQKIDNFIGNVTTKKEYNSQIELEKYKDIVSKIKELYRVIK
jgi:hypothetical protein